MTINLPIADRIARLERELDMAIETSRKATDQLAIRTKSGRPRKDHGQNEPPREEKSNKVS